MFMLKGGIFHGTMFILFIFAKQNKRLTKTQTT